MTKENNAVEIVIPEEAYKQNTVYRPWSDIKAGISTAKAYTAPTQLDNRRSPARPAH
ncbi:Uncharacterised protein [Halioglobus japonicus]|nr:Uncharacterised protein [Halioglobus japonicus]